MSLARRFARAGAGGRLVAALGIVVVMGGFGREARAEDAPTLRLGGSLGFRWFPYFVEDGDAVAAVAEVRAAPRLTASFRAVRAVAEAEVRHDFLDPGRGPRFILREASFGLRWKGLSLDGGALLPRWGRMDYNSPADTIVAWDHEELFAPEPLPVPGLQLGFARDVVAVQGLFVPAFVASRFRTDAPSRWDIVRYLPTTQVVPTPLGDYTFTNRYSSFLRPRVDGSSLAAAFEGGARVELFLPSVDLGFSFYSGHDRLPTWNRFEVTNAGDADGDGVPDQLETLEAQVEAQAIHHRIHVPAFSLAAALGPVVLKGEVAAFLTDDLGHEDPAIDDPYVRAAAGAELVLRNLAGGLDLAARVQWSMDEEIRKDGDTILNQDRVAPIFVAADPDAGLQPDDYTHGAQATPAIRHPFRHTFTWNLNLGFTDALAFDFRGYGDIAGNVLLMPKVLWTVQDHLELSVGALVIPHTAGGSIFAPYARNHRLEVGLAWRL